MRRLLQVPSIFSEELCGRIIDLAKAQGFDVAAIRRGAQSKVMMGVRDNGACTLDDEALKRQIWGLVKGHLFSDARLGHAIGIHPRLRVYEYLPGQQFKIHRDWPVADSGDKSRVTFMVYLNQDCEGGETAFYEYDETKGHPAPLPDACELITPKTGLGVIFEHDWWHEGRPVTSGVKYLFRSDILYTA